MLTIVVVLLAWLVMSVALGLVMGRICEGYPSDDEIEECRRAKEGR